MADTAPATRPCASCPYRRDVPPGVWDASEYEKLPAYDGDTAEQAIAGAVGLFYCHQQNGRLCAGYCGVHDMDESLALRLAVRSARAISVEDAQAILDYTTDVPLFDSGTEAALHGLSGVENPDERARRMIDRLQRKASRRGPEASGPELAQAPETAPEECADMQGGIALGAPGIEPGTPFSDSDRPCPTVTDKPRPLQGFPRFLCPTEADSDRPCPTTSVGQMAQEWPRA